jgi:DNA gyrase subunit A
MQIIKEELDELLKKYGDERKTEIVETTEDITAEDLIPEEDMVITITHNGSIKRMSVDEYRTQKRGGRGITGATTREEDFIEHLFVANTHDYILFFTDRGRVYWLKVYAIPQGSRISKGRPIINLIDIEKGEQVKTFLSVKEFDENLSVVMGTEKGIVKKTNLMAFSRPRKGGIIALNIREDDQLLQARIADKESAIMFITQNGKSINFKSSDIREMGRGATGVKGISLATNDKAIAMVVAKVEDKLLTISANGYGKRTNISEFRIQNRGGSGIFASKVTKKTGKLISALELAEDEDIIIITEKGIIIRQSTANISVIGRNTQGVKLIRLDTDDVVSDVAKIVVSEEDDGTD